MNAADRFVIYDDVNFIRKGWINRNNILVNGKANLFTVPLKNASQNKLISESEISEISEWKKDLLRTIELSYRKAPCFEEVFELIIRIINTDETNISGYIYYSLEQVNRFLNIDTEIVRSSSVYQNRLLKQQKRIIDICKKENAREYINPIGGLELYSKKLFKENEIDLYFIKTNEIVYRQFNNEFSGSLSIIDVMMFNPKDQINEFLNDYELI